MRRLAVAFVILVATVTVFVPGVAAQQATVDTSPERATTEATQVDESADVTGEFVVEPLPDDPTQIRVTGTFSVDGTDQFQAFLDDAKWYNTTIEETSGFSAASTDDGRAVELTWDGDTNPATVTYTIDRPQQYRDGERFENRIASFIDGGEWMYIRDVEFVGHGPSDVSVSTEMTVDTDQPVVDGNGLVFVGEHEEFVRSGGGTNFRVIVPPTADLEPEPTEIAETLANASAEIPTESSTDTTYVYVSGGLRKEVSEAVGNDISIDDKFAIVGSELGPGLSARNTWIHEYVHIRQTYEPLQERLRWFDEGSADYFMMLFSLHQNRLPYDVYMLNLRDGDGGQGQEVMDDTLSERNSYDGNTEYEKGRRVLAALDVKIRQATDGEKTLLDVFARMTEREERLTYAEFKEIVADVAGQSFDDWLDRHVTTGEVPAVPDAPEQYTSTVAGWDSDDDGLADSREAELGTHPFLADTDEDGVPDARELSRGTDPLDANSPTPTATPMSSQSETPSPTAASQQGTDDDTETPTEATPDDGDTAQGTTPGDSGPGFGLGVALAALAGGASLLWRRTTR
jgi:hypothetical protein